MVLQLCHLIKATLLILVWIDILAESKDYKPTCPIGFSLFHRKDHGPLCFRKKGPETFADKYHDCVGNLYTSKLYREYNLIHKPDYTVWTEYKSMHPGGLFVDWSYTKSIGEKFNSVYDVTIDPTLDLEEELCLVMDPISNYTAVKCTEKHYSFCVVKPYSMNLKTVPSKKCGGLKDAVKFWSPESTCLSVLSGVGGGNVRATWSQAQDLCLKKGGSLLTHGWRYINHPLFREIGVNHIYPLGVVMSSDYTTLRYDAINDHSEIPAENWHFLKNNHNVDTLLGSVHDNFWGLVNGSYIFYDVLCEKSVPLKNVTMEVSIDLENKLTLTVNDSLDKDDIYCFTDSVERYPVKIPKSKIDDTDSFVLIPKLDGYYWCTHTDTRIYKATETKKVLFIREKRSVVNAYAVKLRHHDLYKLDDIKDLSKHWEIKLKEYIYYKNKYERVYGDLYFNTTEEVLKQFKNSSPSVDFDDESVISRIKLKRLYMDRRTILIHVYLNPLMRPVSPGFWEGLEIVAMKPVFFCKAFDSIPQLPLGESITTIGCRTHTCVGDFNEGVQWVTVVANNCTIKQDLVINRAMKIFDDSMPSLPSSSTVNTTPEHENKNESTTPTMIKPPPPPPSPSSTTCTDENTQSTTEAYESTTVEEISTVSPEWTTQTESTTEKTESTTEKTEPTTTEIPSTTTTPIIRPPEEKLKQVIENLDQLINNGSTTVMVEDIGQVFDQVDDLLEVNDNLEIPGRLLHLLDKLGAAIELNGSRTAAAVRGNIALILADAEPSNPVRGLRIATRQNDTFTKDAFEMISGELNSTMLDAEKNEVVVNLPQSVSESSHRISFVVFRNDRAFQPSENLYSVNSRVLSIKVGEVTNFDNGEVIDIHLSPITSSPERNLSRTCAYWEFLEDGTGFWSQEGCRLIRSPPGQLDICRCSHLTHFAEVLFPRPVFSQENEDALELLTIIGCCLSIFGIIFVGITSALFRSWRREFNNKIWFQLCISILIVVLSFLVIIFARFDHYNVFCMLLGIILHYSVLASFCWMLVAAVLSYRSLVLVFTRDASHKLLRASAFSWGAPFAVIGVLLSVAPHSYSGRFEEKSPSSSFCYPSGLGLWLSVYLPIAVILLANWTLFGLIVRSVFASRRIQRHGDSNEALRCASVSCLLVFLFGLPWVFGLFAFNIVAAYLFTLTATFQGFILFIFFVLGNKKTRDLWLNKLKIKQTRKVPVTSSTYSNRSNAWRGTTPNVTFEAKVSKPKSLTQDDSRFS